MKAPKRNRISRSDIADQAGVDISTVSRVLNNRPGISEPTRQRVMAAAQELSQSSGVSVTRGGGGTDLDIAVVLPDVGMAFFGEILRGIDGVAHDTGSRVQIACSAYQPQREEAAIKRLMAANASGVILWSVQASTENMLQRLRPVVPIVVVDHGLDHGALDVGTVVFNDFDGARSAAEYVLNLGHRRVGFVAPYPAFAFSTSQARISALRAAMKDKGLDQQTLAIAYADLTDAGYSACMQMLCSEDPPTAIFLNDDSMAPSAYAVMRRLGLVVGQDITIVGFGDQAICKQLDVPLTTVRQDMPLLGSTAAEVLIRMTEDPLSKPQNIVLPASLMVRSSCCPPSKDRAHVAGQAPARSNFQPTTRRAVQTVAAQK